VKLKFYVDRIISLLYDYIFVILLLGFISLILYLFQVPLTIIIICDGLTYFIGYPLICLKLQGSFGKSLNDFIVEPTLGKITYGRVLFREVFMKQLLYLTVIGFLFAVIFFIIKKETLHDFYLKTQVKKT